ncbi:caspase family protein [Thermodesulfobacteriota bacterium]
MAVLSLFLPQAWATSDCDRANAVYADARIRESDQAYPFLMKAIELCPGYIRPYELIGNYHRKRGETDKAIAYFTKAAELGSTNYKLYYLLADLLDKEGHPDEASRYLDKSLGIRENYSRSLKLKEKIGGVEDREGPKIILYEPATRRGLKIKHNYANLTVRGLATDKSGIAWVKVNEKEASLDEQGNFLKDVPIKPGTNTIVVVAVDGAGNESQLSVTVQGEEYKLPPIRKVETPKQKEALYGKSYALVIGINNYEKWPALEFAVADAEAVKKKLQSAGFDNIEIILDREATQRRILTELFHEFPEKVTRHDRVAFYFAGHGQTEDLPKGGKRGYIIPVDADTSNYAKTAISMQQIRSLSSRISAKHIIYVMDSCYSGLGLNRSFGVSPKISDYLRKVASMRAVQIVTAGGKGEQVQEREGHGLFTTYFIKALEGEADFNKDNVVTATELGAYLRPAVSNASNQAQTPLYGRLEGEGEFLFMVRK